jgi:hypothetical protein
MIAAGYAVIPALPAVGSAARHFDEKLLDAKVDLMAKDHGVYRDAERTTLNRVPVTICVAFSARPDERFWQLEGILG